jgi:acetyl-CoA carboxylase biotin carboxylase subunit
VTIEFVVDGQGQFYFTEIKPRIVTEHPLTETRARLDLVREQIRLAAGEPLGLTQADVQLHGWAMSCRINAQDPQRNFMPSPGRLRVRFPNGPETRTDSYVYSGCIVPAVYDPLIAKVTVWAPGRAACLARLQRALHEISFHGIATNAAFLHQLAHSPQMVNGDYTTETTSSIQTPGEPVPLRDLAIAAALRYLRSSEEGQPVTPDRVDNNWHRSARGLPE